MDEINWKRLTEFFKDFQVETLKTSKDRKSYLLYCCNRQTGRHEWISVDRVWGYELNLVLKRNDLKKRLARRLNKGKNEKIHPSEI